MNLGSTKIDVFPSTRRSTSDPSSRLFTEARIAGLVNKLIDTEGFIITPKTTTGYVVLSDSFEFDVYGYYFKIDKVSSLIDIMPTDALSIYATITLDTNNEYVELNGQDESETGIYTGVTFNTTAAVGENVHNLLLLQRNSISENWYTPDASRIRYKYIDAFLIDCGEL